MDAINENLNGNHVGNGIEAQPGTPVKNGMERISLKIPTGFKSMLEGLFEEHKDPERPWKEEFYGNVFSNLYSVAASAEVEFEPLKNSVETLRLENQALKDENETLKARVAELGQANSLMVAAPPPSTAAKKNGWKWAFWAVLILSIPVTLRLWGKYLKLQRDI